jgi:hypothetical protein
MHIAASTAPPPQQHVPRTLRLSRASVRRCAYGRAGASGGAADAAAAAEPAAAFPPLRLGSLVLRSAAILSPMESVSDVAFRKLCYDQGAALTWCGPGVRALAPRVFTRRAALTTVRH